MQTFSKKEAIKFGWETMKANFWFFAGLLLIMFAVSFIPGEISRELKGVAPFLSFIFALIGWILDIIIGIGVIKIALDFVDNRKSEYKELFTHYKLFFRYLGASILYGLIVLGGFILLIAPGVIWAIKFSFFRYFIVDKNAGVMESLKLSAEATKGMKWNLFLLGIILIGIVILGAIALGIGLFAAIPTVTIAYACVYRKLSSYLEGQLEA